MKIPRLSRYLMLLPALLALGGCVRRAPDLGALGADELYRRATAAYEEREYGRAIPLLEAFVQHHFGDPRAPGARLMLGQAHMERRDYLPAATHFTRLVNDYPSSELQLDARFGICRAYYELSPRPALDQEYTHSALLHCQSIGEYYPGTQQAEQATGYVDELRTKLAQKLYDAGMHYLKRRAYDAAVIYFEDVVEQYPRTRIAPMALGRLMEAYSTLGYVEEAAAARERLLKEYPNSPEAQAVRA